MSFALAVNNSISVKFPFESKYIEVMGSRIHYGDHFYFLNFES